MVIRQKSGMLESIILEIRVLIERKKVYKNLQITRGLPSLKNSMQKFILGTLNWNWRCSTVRRTSIE